MSTYDDSERLALLEELDATMTDLQAEGFPFAESEVSLVTVTRTGADEDAGTRGTATETATAIAPRPSVDLRDQWRTVGGERVRVGDGLIRFTRAITRDQILAADHFLIDGVKYRLAAGWLKRTPFRWEAVVVRYR